MAEFKIEKNIPIPSKTSGKTLKYPWDQLEVGDSFFVPNRTSGQMGPVANSASKTRNTKYRLGKVEGGVRIWRVS